MQKYAVEGIGTFFLVVTIGMVVLEPGAGALAPLGIGLALMGLVYAGGHISGAHYNPAVTLGMWMRGVCETRDVPGYLVAQVLGAGLGAAATVFLKGAPTVEPMTLEVGPSLLAEFLFTFALMWVILNVATAKATADNSFYGLAIGAIVGGGAYAVGGVSGAAFNPAVAMSLTLLGVVELSDVWIHLVADFAGAASAAGVFKVLSANDG